MNPSQLQSVCDIIRQSERVYISSPIQLGKYVQWSMYDTIERIDAYLNSKHISGEEDSLGRAKPFFNIVTAATNIWYRATDIDRKDIRFVPTTNGSVVLSLVANAMLQQWMTKQRFGKFLNAWGRSLARYGSSVVKFVEQDGKLNASVIPWNRIIPDQVDFSALPRIEKFYKTPGQLRNMATPGHPDYAGYDIDTVESLILALVTRKTIGRLSKDIKNDFVEIYEVHGLMDSRLLEDKPDYNEKNPKYTQQMHVVSYVASSQKSKDQYDDFTLYKGKERQDPYKITHLIEEDGRTLSIGAVEYLFDPQWMANHTVKNMKDTLDLASKLIFQTADGAFVGRNVLTAIETGDILITADDKPLTELNNSKPDIASLQNFGTMWQNLAQEVTGTPDALRGTTLPSGTPYSLGAYLGGQASSLFEIMTENKGLAIEDMMRDYVIPHLKKQLKNKDQVLAILDDAGVNEIDSIYVPNEAIRRHNDQAKEDILKGDIPSPYQPDLMQGQVRQELSGLGNKRFFKPDELDKKQWSELFSDFEWDNIHVEVTNEQSDKSAVLQTLSSVLQTIAGNPAILQDPNAKMVFSAILTETGKISPLQIASAANQPPPQQPQAPQPQPSQAPPGGPALTV